MTNEQKLEKIKEIAKARADELTENLNDISKDFIGDHDYNDINYLCDAFTEFADNRTSIYYYDKKKFYFENAEYCDNALLEYYDGGSLAEIVKKDGLEALICKAGAVGEYEKNYCDLSGAEQEIKEILSLMHVYNGCSDDDMLINFDNDDEQDLETLLDNYINDLINDIQ